MSPETDKGLEQLAKYLFDLVNLGPYPKEDAVERVHNVLSEFVGAVERDLLASLPAKVSGYTAQPAEKVALVNRFKEMEERILREIDTLAGGDGKPQLWAGKDGRYYTAPNGETLAHDPRWLSIARTHIQEGFMALDRAVFQPQRINLPEDSR